MSNVYVMCPKCGWAGIFEVPVRLEDAKKLTSSRSVCFQHRDLQPVFTTGRHIPLLATLSFISAPIECVVEDDWFLMRWLNEAEGREIPDGVDLEEFFQKSYEEFAEILRRAYGEGGEG
jgi:hypothetical protein